MDLQKINEAENHNLEENIKKFPKEVYFYNELEKLFSICGRIVPDEYVVISNLFQICSHNLKFSFINLLRVHFSEPCMINRKSIEAVGQATIINEKLDINSRVWCRGENNRLGEDGWKLFETTFKKDKFRNCRNKEELKKYYRIFSSFSHTNIMIGMHRCKKEKEKMLFGYFDLEVDDISAWMIRYLDYTIFLYILILEEFADIFGNKLEISKGKIDKLKQEQELYMETKRELLSQKGKYD